jgi:dihydroorotate dehydrogenase
VDVYRLLLRPVLFRLDPEGTHHLAEQVLSAPLPWGLLGDRLRVCDPRLRVRVGGLELDNPVGLAAGMDKNARAVRALRYFGFGYVTVGSILPRPNPGNPRPRVARLIESESLINCYGLPSEGLEACARRLARLGRHRAHVFANIDALTVGDYARSFVRLQPLVSAIEISAKCPNHYVDTGEFMQPGKFEELLRVIMPLRRKPVFLKMYPLPDPAGHRAQLQLVELAVHYGVDGITIPGTWTQPDARLAGGRGHISGRIAFRRNLEIVRELHDIIGGRAVIKALGGISTGAEAFQAIAAGATLVELLTAFVYQGWTVAQRINCELAALMAAHGYPSIAALRGSGAVPYTRPATAAV